MSDLETAAQPILGPLLDGTPSVISLEQQIVIARWVTKTAMVYEYRRWSAGRRFFRAADLKAFYDSRSLPEQMSIYLARYVGKNLGSMNDRSGDNLTIHAPDGTPCGHAYILTIHVGQLALQVFAHRWTKELHTLGFARGDTYNFSFPAVWNRATVEIYPRTLSARSWPPAEALHDGILADFFERFVTDGSPPSP